MHCFEDKGYEFQTGIYYVGRVEKYGQLLNLLSLEGDEVKFKQLGSSEDGYVYDEIRVGSLPPFKLRAGKENFLSDLIKKFPQEEKGIRKYVELCVQCNKDADTFFFKMFCVKNCSNFSIISLGLVQQICFNERRSCNSPGMWNNGPFTLCYSNWSVRQLWIDTVKGQLLYPCWYCIALFKRRVLPIGGPDRITKALVNTIVRCGGKVLVKARVNEILIQSNKVVGVAVNSNMDELIYCNNVITACGASHAKYT